MAQHHIHETAKIGDMTDKQVLNVVATLSDMKIENDLRRQIWNDLKRLKDTGTYRGRRHAMNLPVRGQCTRTQGNPEFYTQSGNRLSHEFRQCSDLGAIRPSAELLASTDNAAYEGFISHLQEQLYYGCYLARTWEILRQSFVPLTLNPSLYLDNMA
ncbi:hypothetical protein KEM54_001950 [Ascosphaera aggregata]|nr:hypothetical protein KEM54_001950 [Ascosphaera aggregata]